MLRQDFFQLPTSRKKQRGQGLVEFSLTLMTFLLLMVMIVEVGRILWTYVTLQHAARTAARYAVTGQWFEQYALDPDGHWDASSDDPLKHIPPCWPRFSDDPVAPTVAAYDAYEPFRNPRTCSVEAVALQAMRPLPMDPHAAEGQPGWYRVRVSGVTNDKYPTTGTFTRGDPPASYSYASYFDPVAHAGDQFGWSLGFAGRPEQTVSVRTEMRLPIITPLLSGVVPSIRLWATATMTNEAYGSTGVQRDAMLPPEIPNVSPFETLLPPDLVVSEMAFNGPYTNGMPKADVGAAVPFTVTVKNIGDIEAPPGYVINLYIVPEGGTPDWNAPVASTDPTASPALMQEAVWSVVVDVTFPAVGRYDVYARVDATDVVDEIGTGEETNPLGETNNTYKFPEAVLVGNLVDLRLTSGTVSNTTPNVGETVTYTFNYDNAGFSTATGVVIRHDLDNLGTSQLQFVSANKSCSLSGGVVECAIEDLTPGASGTLELVVEVPNNPALPGQRLTSTTTIGSAATDTEMNPADNQLTLDLLVGGVDVRFTQATVDNNLPNTGNEITYTVTLENLSPNPASNVRVSVALAAGLDYVNDSAGGAYDSGTGVWTIGDLPPGSAASLQLVARVSATSGSPDATFTLLDTTPVNVNTDLVRRVSVQVQNADLRLTKTVEPWLAAHTEDVVYTLTVTNDGPHAATNVQIVDQLPAGVSYSSHDGGTYNPSTGVWAVGNLGVGASATLTITATVSERTDGTLITNNVNAADVTADQYDPITANNQPSATFEVGNKADLEVSGSVSVGSGPASSEVIATVGQTLRYTITVKNNGPNDAFGVTVKDAIKPALLASLQSVSITGPGSLDSSSGVWSVGNVPAGETRTLVITGTVASRSTRSVYTTTANVTLTEPSDLVPGNDRTSLSVTLADTLADLVLTVEPNTASASFGQTVSYTVQVTNNGPMAATDLQISLVDFVSLDPYVLDLGTATPSRGSFNAGTGRWTITSLASGSSATITISGKVVDTTLVNGPRTYRGTVTVVTLNQWDPTPANANWELNAEWPAPVYYNVGNNCGAITWGDPTNGLEHGHPLIGKDVVWQPLNSTYGTTISKTIYAPAGTTYPSSPGAQISSEDAALFRCLAARNNGQQFNFQINDLIPGRYRVTLLLVEPDGNKADNFTIDVNGTRVFNGNIWAQSGGSRNNEIYYITQGEITVGSDGRVTVNVGRNGAVSGIGLQLIGP